MSKYLDPKNDIVFKKIFGEHPGLLISFLNAVLKFENDGVIAGIEYMKDELVPDSPLGKRSVVDVRCSDVIGRQFIVEMQMEWAPEFMQRMLYNTARIYGSQIERGEQYINLQPVYSLAILNCVFDRKTDEYYHSFVMQNISNSQEKIDGMNMVFVELPKFTPKSRNEKELSVLWLRFLKEIDSKTVNVSTELISNSEINRALEICEEAAYTKAEREAYRKYWDSVRVEKALMSNSKVEGLIEGMIVGEAKGREEGLNEGKKEKEIEFVLNLSRKNLDAEQIAALTDLPVETVKVYLKNEAEKEKPEPPVDINPDEC